MGSNIYQTAINPEEHNLRTVRIVELIQTTELVGAGIVPDACREVVKYWSMTGDLICTIDPRKQEGDNNG